MSNTTTTATSQNKKWYLRFNKSTGKILSVGPRPFVTTNEEDEVVSTENDICRQLITGEKI